MKMKQKTSKNTHTTSNPRLQPLTQQQKNISKHSIKRDPENQCPCPLMQQYSSSSDGHQQPM